MKRVEYFVALFDGSLSIPAWNVMYAQYAVLIVKNRPEAVFMVKVMLWH